MATRIVTAPARGPKLGQDKLDAVTINSVSGGPDAYATQIVGDALAPQVNDGDIAVFCPDAGRALKGEVVAIWGHGSATPSVCRLATSVPPAEFFGSTGNVKPALYAHTADGVRDVDLRNVARIDRMVEVQRKDGQRHVVERPAGSADQMTGFRDRRVYAIPSDYQNNRGDMRILGPNDLLAWQDNGSPTFIAVGRDVSDERLARAEKTFGGQFGVTLDQLRTARAGQVVLVRNTA